MFEMNREERMRAQSGHVFESPLDRVSRLEGKVDKLQRELLAMQGNMREIQKSNQ